MSWFDASGLASIAKTALKEAQKTIDKALDIKDDEPTAITNNTTPIDTNSDDFFGTWSFKQGEQLRQQVDNKDVEDGLKTNNVLQSSLWGSFTGSFFDASKDVPKSTSIDSLDDSVDVADEKFSRCKLVVQRSDDGEGQRNKHSLSMSEDMDEVSEYSEIVERREKSTNISNANRLSVISIESGKNSSESVELITWSPEQTSIEDVLSPELSISTSSAKPNSESVEILPDSLTSPSSVEIISSESGDTNQQDVFASPLGSPVAEEETSPSVEKITPDSVEIIPEDQEGSIAEDTMSYTSLSESTAATIMDTTFLHVKPQKMLKDTYNTSMTESDISLSPDKSHTFSDAIIRAPSRSSMHLPLTQVNQILIDTQPQSSRQELPNFMKNTNIIDIPQETTLEALIESNDEGSQSDRTLVAKDGAMDSSSDTSLTEVGMGGSSYLKTLLADAMTEKSSEKSVNTNQSGTSHFMDLTQSMIDNSQQMSGLENISIMQLDMPPRESSPLSSESRSDLVKIGSDHTSGHTSGDDLETTTSSDIEIISSPNGDSSSTQSRQSPAKHACFKHKSEDTKVELLCKMTMKKAKGHTRELSEASSISDDSHSSEVDRLIKKISEMTEILDSRESKLVDMNRRNAELQELNTDLKHQLDTMLTKQLESIDLSEVTEEYTKRLSALEKKFQQAIRDKDTLRKQLEQSKQEAAARMSKTEMESVMTEKDEIIKELREEGEKLSKQQLQHSNIIKKLRAKEKENESTLKNLKETIEAQSLENERLKRSLTAKEEVERSQIEAVHQLTTKNRKLESEVTKLQSLVEDLTQKYDTVRKSLDAAKKELIDKDKTSSELVAREHMLESLENEKRVTQSQNAAILDQLEDLRTKLRESEMEYVKKEQSLRKGNTALLRRLEDAEARNEELSQSVLEISKPLVRQLESLQATHTVKIQQFEKLEQELLLKTNDLQRRLQHATSSEKTTREECVALRTKVADLEAELSKAKHQYEMFEMQLEQQQAHSQILKTEYERKIDDLMNKLKAETSRYEEILRQLNELQQQEQLKVNKDSEIKTNVVMQEQTTPYGLTTTPSRSNSPTLSVGKLSIAESMGSSFWSQEEPIDIGHAPRYTNMLEMQMLQTNLKQREGEVQQIQWELSRREQERTILNSEISSLLSKVDDLENKLVEFMELKKQFDQIQTKYDTMCQLFGEKVEENEELKLDLQDVKDMYKGQIDELLKQIKQTK